MSVGAKLPPEARRRGQHLGPLSANVNKTSKHQLIQMGMVSSHPARGPSEELEQHILSDSQVPSSLCPSALPSLVWGFHFHDQNSYSRPCAFFFIRKARALPESPFSRRLFHLIVTFLLQTKLAFVTKGKRRMGAG